MIEKPIRNHYRTVPEFTHYDLHRLAQAANANAGNGRADFIQISSELTGFSPAELASTGLIDVYYEELALVVGHPIRDKFINLFAQSPANALTNDWWRPLAHNLMRLWYLGQWQAMPQDWAKTNFKGTALQAYNEFGRDCARVISPQSYQEGLVWRAIGVNPQGAKQPGFASWEKNI